MKQLTILFALIAFIARSPKEQFKIYGGKNHDQFLGCMTCDDEDSNSIWSSYSDYGSMHNPNSIWNPDGKYGSKTSNYSVFNEKAKYPPIILDENGKLYGYFTVNKKFPKRATNRMTEYICKWRDEIVEDIPGHYKTAFGIKYKKE
jgi:hypothetical protein